MHGPNAIVNVCWRSHNKAIFGKCLYRTASFVNTDTVIFEYFIIENCNNVFKAVLENWSLGF